LTRTLHTLVATIVVLLLAPLAGAQPQLQSFQSTHYRIHTNLERQEVVEFGRHMDRVFAEYQRRFSGFRSRRGGPMPLYLFRTQQDYIAFMRQHGLAAENSGGMFFVVNRDVSGLATWTQGKSRSEVFEVLQHEGFHQFAYNYIGPDLPVWANEGLAQYFEDAILVGTGMKLGLVNARRLALVKNAIANNRAVPLDALLTMSYETWNATLRDDPARAALLYAQSWAVVYFLVHGDNGRYQRAFVQYLTLISTGSNSDRAFRQAFGIERYDPMANRWVAYVRQLEPDPVSSARESLEFLATALRFMQANDEPMPRSLDDLRRWMQTRQFRVTRSSHGLQTEFHSSDATMFQFTRSTGAVADFELLDAARIDFPPRLTAPGLRPQPTLVWSRNADGELVADIEYR
jgi:hypothetical protein